MLVSRPVTCVLATLLALPVTAQTLSLDKEGGAIGGPTRFTIQGEPLEPYALLLDLAEQPTTLPALGVTLEISDRFAWLTFAVPGWFGTTDGQGRATPGLAMPNDPGLVDCVFSLQCIAGTGPFRSSNLARVTPQVRGTFLPTLEAPAIPIAGGTVIARDDDEYLFVGGSGPLAQRYQNRTEQWQPAGVTFGVGLLSQSTPLADGRVLFTGGLDATTGQPTDAAAIYDPASGTTTTLTMQSPRAGHGASQLGNGLVLITGGVSAFDLADPLALFNGILGSTELFDPATETFAPGPQMLEPRALHTSTTLTSGQALIAGGITLLPVINLPTVSATAYRFNPASQSFGLPSFFSGARFLHSAAALDDGRVLLAGGLSLDLAAFLASGDATDLVVGTRDDCVRYSEGFFGLGSFETVPGLQVGRAAPAMAPLPGGGALIAGGFQLGIDLAGQGLTADATASADVFTTGPNAITPTGAMAAPRLFPLAVDIGGGSILIVGGGPATAEIYQR